MRSPAGRTLLFGSLPARNGLALQVCALLALAGCATESPHSYLGYQPRPHVGGGQVAASFIVFSGFTGGLEHLMAGPGAALNLQMVLGLVELPIPPLMRRGRPEGDKPLAVSELMLELSVARSFHKVRNLGGTADLRSALIGVRLAWPRFYDPRGYLLAGWGSYGVNYELPARADAQVSGPYLGVGIETFLTPGFSVGADYRAHLVLGEDDAGAPVNGWYHQGRLYTALNW